MGIYISTVSLVFQCNRFRSHDLYLITARLKLSRSDIFTLDLALLPINSFLNLLVYLIFNMLFNIKFVNGHRLFFGTGRRL